MWWVVKRVYCILAALEVSALVCLPSCLSNFLEFPRSKGVIREKEFDMRLYHWFVSDSFDHFSARKCANGKHGNRSW